MLETFLILRRIQRDVITNVHRTACKVPAILVRLCCSLNFLFLDRFPKNLNVINFVKMRPVGAIQTEGLTDMTKLKVAFHNFAQSVPIINNKKVKVTLVQATKTQKGG